MRNKKYTAATLAAMVFIFVQSALPSDLSSAESGAIVDLILKLFEDVLAVSREELVFAVRKGAHFTEYLILGCCLVPAVKEWRPEEDSARHTVKGFGRLAGDSARAIGLAAWLIGTLYAVTDEVHQYFVPGRSCELRDMGIDSCGVLTGVMIVTLAAGLFGQKREKRS